MTAGESAHAGHRGDSIATDRKLHCRRTAVFVTLAVVQLVSQIEAVWLIWAMNAMCRPLSDLTAEIAPLWIWLLSH